MNTPPISAADREKAPTLEGLTIEEWRAEYFRRHEDVHKQLLRVVELETALNEMQGKYNDVRDTVGLWQERALSAEAAHRIACADSDQAEDRAEVSEARATALLEALTSINRISSPDGSRTFDDTIYALDRITDLARAAINAGAPNDRK